MKLNNRLTCLEKKDLQRINIGPLMAFIGVPEWDYDLFEKAREFWDEEGVFYSNGAVRSAVPWPHYGGKETKFLGFGTQADLFFGMSCRVRDYKEKQFLFLADVASLIMENWKEVAMVFDTPVGKRGELEVSEEALEILQYMVKD